MAINLAALTEAEKRELYEQLAYQLRARKSDPSDTELALWDAVVSALPAPAAKRFGHNGRLGLDNVIEAYGRNKFAMRAQELADLLADAVPPNLRRMQRDAVRGIMLRCLGEWLMERGIPITAGTLLQQFDYLRHAVDRQYPGYIEAKLLHRVAVAIAA